MKTNSPRTRAGLRNLAICVVLFLGCHAEEAIVTQQIPKDESGYGSLRNAPSSSQAPFAPFAQTPTRSRPLSPEEITDRMLVAIYVTEELMWFYKIDGPVDQIKTLEPALMAFFEQARFEDNKPVWELPEGWRADGPRPFRHETLLIEQPGPPLELAISNLNVNQDLVMNVNRWRDQMSLPPISKAELDQQLKPLQSHVSQAWLFEALGKKKDGAGGMMSMGGLPTTQPSIQPADNPPATPAVPEVQYEIPDGWEPAHTSSIVPVRLVKKKDDQSAQMTISRLLASANHWEPNVKQWAGQVDVLDWTTEQFDERTETFEVGGITGQIIRLFPDDEQKPNAIIAGMVKQNDNAWFVKLIGDKALVAESEDMFLEFLKSIKFPP